MNSTNYAGNVPIIVEADALKCPIFCCNFNSQEIAFLFATVLLIVDFIIAICDENVKYLLSVVMNLLVIIGLKLNISVLLLPFLITMLSALLLLVVFIVLAILTCLLCLLLMLSFAVLDPFVSANETDVEAGSTGGIRTFPIRVKKTAVKVVRRGRGETVVESATDGELCVMACCVCSAFTCIFVVLLSRVLLGLFYIYIVLCAYLSM